MIKIEAHFYAAFKASQVACELLDVLPETDIHEELKNVMNVQFDLFVHMIEGKHYGTRHLEDFISYTDELKNEATRLKEEL